MDTTRVAQAGVVTGTVVLLVFLFGYEAVAGGPLLGIETASAVEWTFGVFFVALAVLSLIDGNRSLAVGYGSATVGWLLVLLGSSSGHVLIGAAVLVLAGCYVAIESVRLQRAAESPG